MAATAVRGYSRPRLGGSRRIASLKWLPKSGRVHHGPSYRAARRPGMHPGQPNQRGRQQRSDCDPFSMSLGTANPHLLAFRTTPAVAFPGREGSLAQSKRSSGMPKHSAISQGRTSPFSAPRDRRRATRGAPGARTSGTAVVLEDGAAGHSCRGSLGCPSASARPRADCSCAVLDGNADALGRSRRQVAPALRGCQSILDR